MEIGLTLETSYAQPGRGFRVPFPAAHGNHAPGTGCTGVGQIAQRVGFALGCPIPIFLHPGTLAPRKPSNLNRTLTR
jgi:hypothetical protein